MWVQSATHLATKIPVMMGSVKWVSLEISVMITVRDMVKRLTPAKNPAAPSSANAPGSIHSELMSPVCTPNTSWKKMRGSKSIRALEYTHGASNITLGFQKASANGAKTPVPDEHACWVSP